MSFLGLLNRTLTITHVTRTGRDANGDPITTTTTTTTPGRIEQLSTTEQSVGADRETTETTYRLFIPATVSLHAADKVSDGTTTFQVQGEPAVVDGARSAHHIEADLRVVNG